MTRFHHLMMIGLLAVVAFAFMVGRGEAQQAPAGRLTVGGGGNFGLVIDQETGNVWRCDGVDVVCDKLRLAIAAIDFADSAALAVDLARATELLTR